ncbi:MAG: glucuronate isomerase [Clostridiales bacterium]|jgi:glucuronate isomerase|nr:glucuronate isomerase [Clostridiales bacterium]
MKKFLDDDFLLDNETAKVLYNGYAKGRPIFDYHCHLNPREIYEDKKFSDLADVWLKGDHYKWRLMREAGISEAYITGDKPNEEKFLKFAEVMPYAIGNPVYHWSHLELKRFFGIDEALCPKTAGRVWEKANEKLKTLTARRMIELSNVAALCTTDDPADDLKYHALLRQDKAFRVKVLPAFRPDKAVNIELGAFLDWHKRMEGAAQSKLDTFGKFTAALADRIRFFDGAGCVCSDHALDEVAYRPATFDEAGRVYEKALNGEPPDREETARYKGFMLAFLGGQYNKYNWVQQYHIGALRNASSRNMLALGADTGFDAIGDKAFAADLVKLLDSLDRTGELPKTILYCLNPRDNEVLACVRNCFQGEGTAAKIQFGSAWWFNDQKDGIARQIEALAQTGLLSKFVGMLTDSRSFLSYPRHEYFRRILCSRLGALIENGEYPPEIEFVGGIVRDICCSNAERYFKK